MLKRVAWMHSLMTAEVCQANAFQLCASRARVRQEGLKPSFLVFFVIEPASQIEEVALKSLK